MLEQRQEPQCDGPAGLAEPQHVSLAALPEVEVGELEAVQRGGHRLQPFACLGSLRQPGGKQAQAGVLAAADATTQLVQLADAEPVGVHHEHHRGVGHVDTDLDDGRAHQNIDLPVAECGHHRVLFVGRQPAVHQPQPQPGQRSVPKVLEQLDHGGGGRTTCRLPAVVGLVDARRDDIGLPSRLHFLGDPLPRPVEPLRLLRDENRVGGDRLPTAGQLAQCRRLQIAINGECDGARNRRGGHHQQVRRDALWTPWRASDLAVRHRTGAARRPRPCRGRLKSTASCSRAWVPMTMPASPEATSSRTCRFCCGDIDPVSSATRVAPSAPPSWPAIASGPRTSRTDRACWAARTSVGASSAH